MRSNRGAARRRRGRPPESDAGETLARILQTATSTFALHGFVDTTLSAIAEGAGVTQPTLYYYFESKAALYEAVAVEARRRLNRDLIDPLLLSISGNSSIRSRLTTLVIGLVHRAPEDLGTHRLGFASDLEAHHSGPVEAFRDGVRADLRRLYCGLAGVPVGQGLSTDERELVAFIEMLTLGVWHFAVRPGGLERIPIFVRSFEALMTNSLFGAEVGEKTVEPLIAEDAQYDLTYPDQGMRETILSVAKHRFARAGYGKTSLKELASEAGVTTGAIYHYFGSKDELYREVGIYGLQQTLSGTQRRLSQTLGEESQRERVQGFFETLSIMVDEYEDNFWMGVTLELDAAGYPAVAEAREYWARQTERVFQVAVATEPDPDDAGWDRDPLLVLVLVFSMGGVCTVVRNGPGFLPTATRGLQRFLADSSTSAHSASARVGTRGNRRDNLVSRTG